MALENRKLKKELVTSPEYYRGIIRIAPRRIDAAVLSMRADGSLLLSGTDTDGSERELEEFVYDNPLLLSPFERTDIVFETDMNILVPNEADPEQNVELLMDEAFPERESDMTYIVNPLQGTGYTLLAAADEKITRFLNRCFSQPAMYSHLTPLIRFFGDRRRTGNSARIFVNLRKGSVDVIVMDKGKLLLANSFHAGTVADMVYYILAVRQQIFGPVDDEAPDEIMVSGEASVKRELLPELRKYVRSVIPVIFPATLFRIGREALTVPFDQIIIPICE